jgi:pimeloyl-ACP methyl ester carboxylesterase
LTSQSETVVLIHGLWLHGVAMLVMKRGIARCGYEVKTYSYPTVRLDLDQNAERLASFCARLPEGTLHFVAHSMGGLVAMRAAEKLPRSRIGRLVLLGTPYQDSYSARQVQRLPGGRRIIGRCMGQWLTEPKPGAGSLDIGVIAGTGRIGLGRVVAHRLPQPNDGVVSVDETRVPGMRDHVVVRISHTLMLVSRAVVHQVCTYLGEGKFDRAAIAAP